MFFILKLELGKLLLQHLYLLLGLLDNSFHLLCEHLLHLLSLVAKIEEPLWILVTGIPKHFHRQFLLVQEVGCGVQPESGNL